MSSTRGYFPYPGPNPFGPEMSYEAEHDLEEHLEEARRRHGGEPPPRRTWLQRLRDPFIR